MSRENVEIVERLYDAFARRDVPEILSRLAPEVEITQSTALPWGGVYKGPEQFGLFFRNLTQHINSTLVFERYLDSGDQVVAIGRTQGTAVATGYPFDVPIVHLWRLREGKVLSFQPYIDNPTMQASLLTRNELSMTPPESPLTIELTRDVALVLFDLLYRFENTEKLEIQHPAEEQALWSLSGLLDRELVEPFRSDYAELLDQARARLRPDQE